MFEPTLALQTAIRSALLSSPDVMALVPADNIRAASTRPDNTPAIIMSDGATMNGGHDYASQRTAMVFLDIHIWHFGDDAQDAAKTIAGAATAALDKPLLFEGCDCDHLRVTASRFPRDPDPAYGHGILSVEALVRWII